MELRFVQFFPSLRDLSDQIPKFSGQSEHFQRQRGLAARSMPGTRHSCQVLHSRPLLPQPGLPALMLEVAGVSDVSKRLFWLSTLSASLSRWLVKEGREKEARQSLAWLRGAEYNLQPEMKELEAVVAGAGAQNQEGLKSVRGLLTDRSFLAPLFVSCSCFLFQAMCGCDTISYYTGYIFKQKQIRMEYAAIIFQVQNTTVIS